MIIRDYRLKLNHPFHNLVCSSKTLMNIIAGWETLLAGPCLPLVLFSL